MLKKKIYVHLQSTVAVDQYVSWLQISVHDAQRVHILQRANYLICEILRNEADSKYSNIFY